jgi:hypothetical protein
VTPWHDGFIAGDGDYAWSSKDGNSWVPLGIAPNSMTAVGGVLVGVSDGFVWSSDGATWTAAATGPQLESVLPWTIRSDGRVAIATDGLNEMRITTDGRTWLNTGTKLVITESGEHGVPSYCVGAVRLVTIISDGNLTRAYYADLLE